jgi:solute carrier family 25 (mitochondrial carrier protein), member 16
MPSAALAGHASMPERPRAQHDQARENGDLALAPRRHRDPALYATDNEAVMARQQNKRSFDYVWRSGVAGGVAGCAVRFWAPSLRVGLC